MGFWGDLGGYIKSGAQGLFGSRNEGDYAGVGRQNFELPRGDAMIDQAGQLGQMYGARRAAQAADDPYWQQQQRNVGAQLERQLRGEDSMAQLQLRGATDANIAQQRSMASSASPANSAMAQRLAMQNVGRINQGFGSQAAMAGIQERAAAAQGLAGLAGQARGQTMQGNQFNVGAQLQQTGLNDAAQNAAYNRALAAAQSQQAGGMGYEQQRTQRAVGALGTPTTGENVLGGLMGAGQMAVAASDVRLKEDIRPGLAEANQFMDSVKPATYSYKNPQAIGMPPGVHTGVMAQDLERTRAGSGAVVDTPDGKMVDYGQLGGVMTASLAALNQRLKGLEKMYDYGRDVTTASGGQGRTKPNFTPRANEEARGRAPVEPARAMTESLGALDQRLRGLERMYDYGRDVTTEAGGVGRTRPSFTPRGNEEAFWNVNVKAKK